MLKRILFDILQKVLFILRIDRCTSETGRHKYKSDYSKPFMEFEFRGKQYGTTQHFICRYCKKEISFWSYLVAPH